MAYWGEAMAYNQPLWFHEDREGRAVLAKLGATPQGAAGKATTPRERGFLRAVEALCGPGDKPARDKAYADAMAAVAQQNPETTRRRHSRRSRCSATLPRGDASLPLRRAGRGNRRRRCSRATRSIPARRTTSCTPTITARSRRRRWRRPAPTRRSRRRRATPSTCRRTRSCSSGYWARSRRERSGVVGCVDRLGTAARLLGGERDFHSLTWLQDEMDAAGAIRRRPAGAVARGRRGDEGGRRPRDTSAAITTPTARSAAAAGRWRCATTSGSMRARYIVESERWSEMNGQGTFDNVDELFALGHERVEARRRAAGARRCRRVREGVGARAWTPAARAGGGHAARAGGAAARPRRAARRRVRRRWTGRWELQDADAANRSAARTR